MGLESKRRWIGSTWASQTGKNGQTPGHSGMAHDGQFARTPGQIARRSSFQLTQYPYHGPLLAREPGQIAVVAFGKGDHLPMHGRGYRSIRSQRTGLRYYIIELPVEDVYRAVDALDRDIVAEGIAEQQPVRQYGQVVRCTSYRYANGVPKISKRGVCFAATGVAIPLPNDRPTSTTSCSFQRARASWYQHSASSCNAAPLSSPRLPSLRSVSRSGPCAFNDVAGSP